MFLSKKIIQYNNLVFSGFSCVFEQDDDDTSFKADETEYTYGNGSYVALRRKYPFVKSKKIGITIKISTKRVPTSQRKYIHSFAISELSKQGKLWAIENGTLLWANAYPTSLSKAVDVGYDEIEISADFSLFEGVWHKADIYKTYLKPFDTCDFLHCYHYQEVKIPCEKDNIECCCDDPTIDMSLCNSKKELEELYNIGGYQIIERKDLAERYFGKDRGVAICSNNCDGIITGAYYSDTDIPTTDVKITIKGELDNPEVEVNGNVNMYLGQYKNLVIYPNGEAKYYGDTEDCAISPENIIVGDNNTLGFTIMPRENHIKIRTGKCCKTCAYIDVNGITI